MIKKRFPVVCLVTFVLLLTIAGASCTANKINASLGQEFTLPVGKTAVVTGESLSIKFVKVTGDSRCPEGVQCIQAGDVKCQILIEYLQSQSVVVLTQLGGNDINKEVYNKYTINFRVEPYPEYGKQIASSDYQLVMTVTK
jgi:hypothetical protein